ncbi:MAG: DUF790 family protein [Acidobacteriota bacterium]
MLTSDLVLARVYKKKVRPRFIGDRDPEMLELAGQLIETFAGHRGEPRHRLDAELGELLGTGTDFQRHRGLAKLLFDRCEFEAAAPVEPEQLRAQVFQSAAAAYRSEAEDAQPFEFDRSEVLETSAAELGVAVDAIEQGLYADLKSEQVLQDFKPCGAEWLLRRYNVALAQGVLLRASRLDIELAPATAAKHRALFRKVKFFQLMHRVKRLPEGGWRLTLDGPVSVFKSSGKYGLQMASFLPTLLHFEGWTLEAAVEWGPKRRKLTFALESDGKLRSHTRLDGQWQPEEIKAFGVRFDELGSEWRLDPDGDLVDLGGEGVLVPDFVFEHRRTGLRVVMEIYGFWNRGAVASRLKLIRKHGPERLLLAISSQLAAGREELGELTGEVYVFRTQPVPRKVLKALESFS